MASFSRFFSSGTTNPRERGPFQDRLTELGGFILLALALALGVALWSYNPQDPSFDTATTAMPTNLLGQPGATLADGLVQWLGLASALPIIVMLCWAWQIMRHHALSVPVLRFIAFFCLLPVASALIATLQVLIPALTTSWPSRAGLGGQLGLVLASHLVATGHAIMGRAGGVVFSLLGLLLAILLVPLAVGLRRSEWRALFHGVRSVGRGSENLARRMSNKARQSAPPDWSSYEPVEANAYRHEHPYPAPRRGQEAARAPFIPANTGWLQPPEKIEEPVPATRTPQASNPAPVAVQKQPPSNPYAMQLAQIARDQDSAPRAAAVTRYSEIEDTTSFTEEQPSPPPQEEEPKRGFFGFGRTRSERSAQPQPAPAARQGWENTGWQPPSLGLLRKAPAHGGNGPSNEVLQANARLLEQVLSDYGVQGQIGDIHAGPVVTLYELEPAPGIRSARVIGLADDIARSLSVLSVRIATVPGRNVIGIEVPNASRETVYFSELLDTPEFHEPGAQLRLALGKDIAGNPVYADLAKMPHLLIAGTTGSGKSVGVNAMILSLLYRLTPEECRLIMIDPKILELSIYDGIPHLLTPVVTEPNKAVAALKWTVREMDKRYRSMAHLQVRNITGYNQRVRQVRSTGELVTRRVQTGFDPETGQPVFDEQQLALETMPHIVVVIDEMADLMMVAGKEIEAAVQRLAQKARAAGIHVIMATQRPSVDVITGTIKANFPTRISFQVISKFDSRTILGEQGSEQLLGQGDMLYMQGAARITRVHGPFVADSEVEDVVADLRSKGEPVYNDEVISSLEDEGGSASSSGNGMGGGNYDAESSLFDQAVDLVTREGKASTSFIQRHLSIGYNRAAKIIEQMEKEGIVSAANHVGKREVLARRQRDED
ncbi:DNA translocase FtsK 4TM domain-containing protein [Asaia bogorensis]|uniref:FtsK/SpoIIIE family DNA translocase n=1 Tax=Asaia bogorensis TaxID=91915 RepID=UPI000EFC6224|nr:DNA translocase FtsK 4TM domain-containing protein [Asaia bogorensis]